MAVKLFPTDRVLTDNVFLELGFDMSAGSKEDYVPRFDVQKAVARLRSEPALAARFLSLTDGNGDVYWAGDLSSVQVDGGTVGVNVIRRRTGDEASGDNVYGKFLEKVRGELRRSLSDTMIEEVPVGPNQVITDFTRVGAYASDIEERERSGERFIHVDTYRPARFRFDASMDGTTGHAGRAADDEVPFHKFVCPFGTAYPSPVIVGSAAEASVLYEQALRGELDWEALFRSLKDRNLLDAKLSKKQVDFLISEYKAQFDWMRDEIVLNPALKGMTVVASSNLVADSSMGRSVYDAESAPSPAHVLARYINNPLLLYLGGENGVMRSLGLQDKGEPERFQGTGGPVTVLVAGSDTIGGRQPGRKATQKIERSEVKDAEGRSIVVAKKVFDMPMKTKAETDKDYAAFSARMDAIMSGMPDGVTFVTGNASSLSSSVGIGTPRMLERYVKEHGGAVYQYNFSKRSLDERPAGKDGVTNPGLSVVLMEHFGDCLPALLGKDKKVTFRLNPNMEDSDVTFECGESLKMADGAVCLTVSEDLGNRNILSVGSMAVDAHIPVVHVQELRSEEEQRIALEKGAVISRSGLFVDAPVVDDIFRNERLDWDLGASNHLSSHDDATGLSFPMVAEPLPSPTLVEGQSFYSPLSAFLALSFSEMLQDTGRLPEMLKAVVKAEGNSTELIELYRSFLGGRDVSDVLGDPLEERFLREAVHRLADANSDFMERLISMDGRDVVMSSSAGESDLFVSPDGKGRNRFGVALAAERDALKALREARIVSENEEREKMVAEAAKRQKLAVGAKAEGQKVVGGLPRNAKEAKDAVWFMGTHDALGVALPDGQTSFEMWDDMGGEDPLVREKVARPTVPDGDGGEYPNDYIYLFPTDLGSVTGRSKVSTLPNGRNLTGITRVNPETGETFTAAFGIPVRFNNKGYEFMNDQNMPCSYRLDDNRSDFLASLIVADSRARSTALKQGFALILPGRSRLDGTNYYTLGQVFMPQIWSVKEHKMVPNPHQAPLNLSIVETYISLLESGRKYPLNCIPMPRSQYHTQDDAVLRGKLKEGKSFISAEGRFMADLMMSLQIANATAIAMGVPLRFPLDKDGHIDLGPGVPEQYRLMAEKRIDSFIGVQKEEQIQSGNLPLLERIPVYDIGSVRELLVKAGTDLYMRPNDLVVAFGQYDFSSLFSGQPCSLHEMAFRMEDGTIFSIKDSKLSTGVSAEDINKYLSYSKNDERRFLVRTTDPDKVPEFFSLLKAYSERAAAIKVDVRLVTEAEVKNGGLEGFVNLLSSNSEQFAESEHDIGREATVFNATARVRQEVEKDENGVIKRISDVVEDERNIDGDKTSGVYYGKVDANDGFRGYAQIKFTMPNGVESDWRTIEDLNLAKDTVMSLVSRKYRSDSYFVPSPKVMEMLWKAEAVKLAGSSFRDFEWSASHKRVIADDKVVELERGVEAKGQVEVPAAPEAEAVPVVLDHPVSVTKASGNWSREEVAADSKRLYVFTDNTDRDSGSGIIDRDSAYYQRYGNGKDDLHFPTMTAAVIRGLDNAMPVSTQRWYHEGAKGPAGRWQDTDAAEFAKVISEEFRNLREKVVSGGYDEVVFPGGDGLFNGKISDISETRVPELYSILKGEYESFLEFCQGDGLSQGVDKAESKKVEVSPLSSDVIVYTESDGGYQKRTVENANADDIDFTLAFAVDFNTYGEKATKKAAGSSYIGLDITDLSSKNLKEAVKQFLELIPDYYLKGDRMGLNIAGNGIYTLAANGISQEAVDEFVTKFISAVQESGCHIDFIRTGGQTGIDEAGIAAAVAAGIPCECHVPKGWLFRDSAGKDRSEEKAFKARFESKDYGRLKGLVKPRVSKMTKKGSNKHI